MTVIAWDGTTLAIDRQLSHGEIAREGQKWSRLANGGIFTHCGDTDSGLTVRDWIDAGSISDKWPSFQTAEKGWVIPVILQPDGTIGCYYQQPVFIPTLGPMAWGSGREVALGAMAFGATAIEAVLTTNKLHIMCGFGCDHFIYANGEWIHGS